MMSVAFKLFHFFYCADLNTFFGIYISYVIMYERFTWIVNKNEFPLPGNYVKFENKKYF